MAADERWSFSNELSAMSTMLERAGKMTSTLRALHEAEMHSAVSEINMKVAELNSQLSLSQKGCLLPQEVMDVQSERSSMCSLPKNLSEDSDSRGGSQSPQKQNGREDSTLEPSWLKADAYLPHTDMPPAHHLADVHQAVGRDSKSSAASAGCMRPSDIVDLRASARTSCASGRRPRCESIFTGGIRDIWAGAEEESINVLASRCRVHIVHYEDSYPGSRSRSRTLGSRQSLENALLSSTKFSATGAAIGQGMYGCAFGIIDPIGPVRSFWNVISLIFIAYDLIVVPMQAFAIEEAKALQVFEWALTVWWTFDVYMTFRTGYVLGLRVEMRPRKIAVHYAKTWLLCDSVIVILEWVNRFAVAFGSVSLLRSSRSLRTLRYVRLFRASKIRTFFNGLQEQVNSNVMHLCITMTILGGVLLLTIHVTACVWYALGESRGDGWTTYDVYEGYKDKFFWYVTSFRWVISQLNGRTDMHEKRNMLERFFTCTVGVALAVIAQAVFISYITKIMLDLSELVSEKTARRRAVNHYLEANPLPPLLTAQVKRALSDYHDIDQELRKEDQVLAILPNHLKTDVLEEVRAPVLVQHPFFHALPFESYWIMRIICRKVVQTVSASKDEVVFDKGDVCERMLFTDKLTALYGKPADPNIWRNVSDPMDSEQQGFFSSPSARSVNGGGTPSHRAKSFFGRSVRHITTKDGLDLLESAYGMEPKTIRMGSWISEAALWVEWRNQGRLISNGHGVLLAVKASRLAHALKNHPDAFALAYIHGSNVAAELSNEGQCELSDVLPFEVQLHSPLRVSITVIGAKGLRNADCFVFGKSDPYCVCNIIGVTGKSGETRFKTRTVDNSLDPVWNHSAEVLLSFHQQIEFQIFDADFGKHDTVLGVARVSPDEFAFNGFQGDLQLRSIDGGPSQGSVSVKIQVMDVEEPPLLHLWPAQSAKKNIVQKKVSQIFARRPSTDSVATHLS